LWLFGIKYYILVAVAHTGKFVYMRAYQTHSSFAARDFLARLEYLLGAAPEVILTDNGSEFEKHFEIACQQKQIKRYFSRVQTPKDNPEVERMNKTYIEEWLNDGKWSPNLYKMNKYITDFLIYYNHERPHEKLNYDTPLAYAETHGLLTKRSSSSTSY
jgi:transposase InsO family protein